MDCKINTWSPPILCKLRATRPNFRIKAIAFSSCGVNQQKFISTTKAGVIHPVKTDVCTVNFKTLGGCKLGISAYPDFQYNAEGGKGTGTGRKTKENDLNDEISVTFDLVTLYIPPLTSGTTKFLGLPLPPFLKIDIVPEIFEGTIDHKSGQVDLEFMAKFCFSIGSIYRAPPLLVKTVLTSEESRGSMRNGRGERLDGIGKCRLVGVATVDPIDDIIMNSFLRLPTECLANLNAVISFTKSY